MKITILLSMLMVLGTTISAQNKGILPFTGAKYHKQGLDCKKIKITLEGDEWTSNRLARAQEFKVKLDAPTGFKLDDDKNYQPNISIKIVNEAGEVVGEAKKFMGANPLYDNFSLTHLTLTLGFKKDTPLGKYAVFISFYDQLSENKLDIEMNLDLIADNGKLDNTKYVYAVSSYKGFIGQSTGTNINTILASIDEKFKPSYISHNIHIKKLENLDLDILKKGKYTIEVYDAALNLLPESIIAKDPFVYYLADKDKENTHKIYYKIYFKGDNTAQKDYFTRFRWESEDGKKVIDFVNQFKE